MNQTESTTYDHEGNVIESSVTTTPLPASSVEIATDGKGNPKPTVKVYHDDPREAKLIACSLYAEIVKALGAEDKEQRARGFGPRLTPEGRQKRTA